MNPLLSLKTLLRAPVRTLVTFLLIAAASFALFSRVADYAVTAREVNRAVSYYRGVAALDTGVPVTWYRWSSFLPNTARFNHPLNPSVKPPLPLTEEQIEIFSSLPGVNKTDTRYMTAGIIEDMDHALRYGNYHVHYDYTARFILEGTIDEIRYVEVDRSPWNDNRIKLTDIRVLAGALPFEDGGEIIINARGADRHGGWVISSFSYELSGVETLENVRMDY